MSMQGETVLIGITGGIASYKICNLTSRLVQEGCDVHVIMTEAAAKFVSPMVFETLTKHKCIIDTFDREFSFDVEHISLAKKADLFLVAPATANTMAKLAYGIADNMLTTTFLAATCPKLIAPAMNTNMYNNPITVENMDRLEKLGMEIIPAASGYLACGDIGDGKMPEPDVLYAYIERELYSQKDMEGMRVLVTAGATEEALDPVRFITNHSTGKMGMALAKMAMLRGAQVFVIRANTKVEPPMFVQHEEAKSAKAMFELVKAKAHRADVIIKAAAVSDYRPRSYSDEKIKKSSGDTVLELERTDDILSYLGNHRSEDQILCGFSMETENLVENSKAKLLRKNVDIIVANNLKDAGAGFGHNTNEVTIITNNKIDHLPLMSKEEVADAILDEIVELRRK